MAFSTISTPNKKIVWNRDFTTDFYRKAGYVRFMGDDANAIIRVRKELSKEKGTTIKLAMLPKLSGNGITGSQLLRGNAEAQRNWSFSVTTAYGGNSVEMHEAATFDSEIDLLNAARPQLQNWASRRQKKLISGAIGAYVVRGTYADDAGNGQTVEDTVVAASVASATVKDLHLDNNKDRILFANSTTSSNRTLVTTGASAGASNSFSGTVATITSADRFTLGIARAAKRLAQMTEEQNDKPSITPVSTDADEFQEEFVCFYDLNAHRDLQDDLKNANLDGRPRDIDKNPFFTGGCLYADGITFVPIPGLAKLTETGAAGTKIGHAALVGANALGHVVSMMPEARTDEYSYGQVQGAGVVMYDAYSKIAYNGAQLMVSILHASVD